MAGCLSFVMDCFGIGDLGTVGTTGVASTLDTFVPGASDTAASELRASAGLVAVILYINNSRATRETFAFERNYSQNSRLIDNR